MHEFVHVWHFQYIWEESVTGVCIVPAQRLPAPGSFITQTPLLSLLCLYWTRPPLPLPPPSETLSSHTPISKQLQETVLPTEWSAALIRILFSPPPLFFFSTIYDLLKVYLCLSLEANSKTCFRVPNVEQWNKSSNIFPLSFNIIWRIFLTRSLPHTGTGKPSIRKHGILLKPTKYLLKKKQEKQ